MPQKFLLAFVFGTALLLRLLLVPNPGFEADVSFWKSWGLATYDKGVVEGIKLTNNNYPTPFAYTLGFMVRLYSLVSDPHNFKEFWQNTNLVFLAVAKIFPILADLGIAFLLYHFTRFLRLPQSPDSGQRVGLLLATLYLFNPVALIDGAWWGQVDSLGVFIFLLAFLLTLKQRPFAAGFVFMLAMMTKLQNMIYGPLLFLFVWQSLGWNGLIKAVTGATVGFLGLNIEFFLSANMGRVLSAVTGNYDYFPLMSLNAFNLWWIAAGGAGMGMSDKVAVLGVANAKQVGLLLFSSFYLFTILRQAFWRGELWVTRRKGPVDSQPSPVHTYGMEKKNGMRESTGGRGGAGPAGLIQTFIEGLIIVNASFFLFMTQSHDRYLFPIIVFLLLWFPFVWNHTAGIMKQGQKHFFSLFIILYSCFSLLYFYNLHTALVFNYPTNGLALLSRLTAPAVTMTAPVLFLIAFAWFLLSLVRSSVVSLSLCLFSLLLLGMGLAAVNANLFTKKPLSLTTLTPLSSQQDYGSRQTNRSVNSSLGYNNWTRLSVQYAFYDQGIGTHANSRHVYDINRNFRSFTTDFGLDTETGLRASAVFEIWGDNRLLLRSDTMKKFDLPRHADVDVTGIKYLTLVTTDSGDGITDDHTDWLRPTLWP